MPTRIYSEDSVKKRKILSGDEKPTRKYTKTIKQEIKKEPMEMSDGDIDDDDVMDIEEADGTLPKKGRSNPKQKRVVKTKKVKKVVKVEKDKDGKEVSKAKPKRKKKPQPPTVATTESTTPIKTNTPADSSKPVKKVPKVKEKKVKPKPQKPAKKSSEKDGTKTNNDSDSDSSREESDAYETCGVVNCQRPSGGIKRKILKFHEKLKILIFLFQNRFRIGFCAMEAAKFGTTWSASVSKSKKSTPTKISSATIAKSRKPHKSKSASDSSTVSSKFN